MTCSQRFPTSVSVSQEDDSLTSAVQIELDLDVVTTVLLDVVTLKLEGELMRGAVKLDVLLMRAEEEVMGELVGALMGLTLTSLTDTDEVLRSSDVVETLQELEASLLMIEVLVLIRELVSTIEVIEVMLLLVEGIPWSSLAREPRVVTPSTKPTLEGLLRIPEL